MFNGDDRDDAPKCHPETRKSILGDIEPWAISVESEAGIIWLTGPVGTGKSAIARKVCEDLNQQDLRLVAGSFFFWRSDSGRSSLETFIPTIAYRLSVIIPGVGELIRQALVNDPSTLNHSLEVQWDTLVIKPLRQTLLNTEVTQRSLIVIDGLDECESYSNQLRLLRLLPALQQHGLHKKIAVLLASRPESHIQSEIDILAHDHPTLFRLPHLMLSETEESREDMQLILTTSFNDIYRRRRRIIGDHQWPPEEAVDRVVNVANGQFVYVLTVVRWLSDEDGHPVERLEAIFRTYDSQRARAFAPLDRLYSLILEAAVSKEAGDLVLPCLFLLTYRFSTSVTFAWQLSLPQASSLSRLFQKDCGYIRLVLQPLHSVLRVPDGDDELIQTYHKSFSEYLHEHSRSDFYCLRSQKVLTLLLTQSLKLEYQDVGLTFQCQNLRFIWLFLPLGSIEVTQNLVDSLVHTHAADWARERLRADASNFRYADEYNRFFEWINSKLYLIPMRKKVR
ncbi:hypothetical protein AX16_005958 [Volvariella volvacea WC 439]|nr:hypothetical protein AX16_005958 [Volvariella volvacea WC 439]